MMFWALVLAADMFAGLTEVEVKKRRRNEMLGNWYMISLGRGGCFVCGRRGGVTKHSLK